MTIFATDFYVRCVYPSRVPGWEGEVRVEARPGLYFTRDIARAIQVRMYYYSTVLYSTLLYYTLLYCIVLYSTVLYSTILYSTRLHCTLL